MPELAVLKTERDQFREDVVQLLEDALAEARDGEIAAIGLAVVRPGGHANCGFTDFDTAGQLLGAVALLQARMIASMIAKDD